ncbi:MAG TPA: inorganic phosphate transporter [Candidatus Limnocylindria bacterium]|nr:inorganic phosphate transporter [Candidatus Limnocylindria bacterium]
MDEVIVVLVVVVIAAVVFDFINGFHDTANAIATVIATRVLAAWQAILMAAGLNFLGALSGTAVAKTIGSGLIDAQAISQGAVLAALLGAIFWNLLTWYYGIPSSSSHALVGGIIGGAVAHAGVGAPLWGAIVQKTVLPFVLSPIIGFVLAFVLMAVVLNLFQRAGRRAMGAIFGKAQLASSAFMAFSHGSNDAQKTMGVITIALFSAGMIGSNDVPTWVIIVSALAMALGTAAGGWRIIRTMGTRLTHLEPVHGFVAETAAASVIEVASRAGFPLSTTHTIASTIMGVGATRGPNYVRWNVAGNMVTAWILTIPATAAVAFVVYKLLSLLGAD